MWCNTTIFPVDLRFVSNYQLSGDPWFSAPQMKRQSRDTVVGKVVLSGRKLAAELELLLASQHPYVVNQTLEVCSILELGRIENYPNSSELKIVWTSSNLI